MKIVISPDSFKGCLSAFEVAAAIADGIKKASYSANTVIIPIADGGEGTLDAIVPRHSRVFVSARSAAGKSIDACFGLVGETAIIETAQVAGLALTRGNVIDASTYGVGELILAALDRGLRRIMLTVGGSGTNDGGVGMFEALGAVFLDTNGKTVSGGGAVMGRVASVDLTRIDPRLAECEIIVATDAVDNPLTGANGATMVYGRQKGADDDMLDFLEMGMRSYAKILAQSGVDVDKIRGSGAGGGIAAPLLAYTNARIVSGIDAVLEMLRFEEQIKDADFVITGEGRTDYQSSCGKAVSGVIKACVRQKKDVFVFCGAIGEGAERLFELGARGISSITEEPCTLEYAMQNAQKLLINHAYRWAKMMNF